MLLITGGAGYIGSHAVYEAIEAGYEVIVLDDLSTGFKANLPNDIIFYKGNIGDSDLLDNIFKNHKISSVIHFAGSIIVPESVIHPEKYFVNNTGYSAILIQKCIEYNVNEFIFSSTAAVYGIPEKGMANESDSLAPINPYGKSKLLVENILEDVAKAHPDFSYAALRYFNVAGADKHLRCGQRNPNATHLIKIISQHLANKRKSFSIFGNDYNTYDGTCIRDYIHVTDLAKVHLETLKYLKNTQNQNILVLNCGNGKGYSVLDIVKAAEKLSENKLNYLFDKRRLGDPEKLVAETKKIHSILPWKAEITDINDIIESAYNWEMSIS